MICEACGWDVERLWRLGEEHLCFECYHDVSLYDADELGLDPDEDDSRA